MTGAQIFEGNVQILTNYTQEQVLEHKTKQENQEDAFFVFNAGDVIQKIKAWRLKMPRVKVFYAMKCNDSKPVLEVLKALGTGFDVASKVEMTKLMDLGIKTSHIIYAHPCKPLSHLKAAKEYGIDMMTFDNESELYKVRNIMPNARLVLRIRCDALKAQCNLGVKFGALPSDAKDLLQTAFNLGLNIIGVCFHVGSGCQEPAVFSRAIKMCRIVFDQAIEIGFNPYLLDLGGGYPGDSPAVFSGCAFYINEALEKYFPEELGVEVIAEPGRYVVSTAFFSATQIISKRETRGPDGGLSTMYYVNDGVYGSFNCILYDHQVVQPTLLGDRAGKMSKCSIWGPTCDGLDQLIESSYLPSLQIGEWLMWKNMGAYTVAAANTFNGFPIPQVDTVIPQHNLLYLESIVNGESDYNVDWCQVTAPAPPSPRTKTRTTSCAEDCDPIVDAGPESLLSPAT